MNEILDILLEDGEAERDQHLDIDELSDDKSIIDYEEEDNFSSNANTQQHENPSWSREAEKVESPDGDIDFESENELEHSNTDQNRNSIDAGTVDEVIELPLDDDDQLRQGPDNHSDKEMPQPPKHTRTRGGFRNHTGRVHTRGGRTNCGGLHFGNHGRGNQASGDRGSRVFGSRARGTGAGRAHSAGRAGIGGHGRHRTDDSLNLEWEQDEPDNEENVDRLHKIQLFLDMIRHHF